ncbi:MAG: uncharacterized protein JWM76_632 [Pseudonocardiales bacterium]|nr:uncharacterized protein [Pseudonocardiales bacterium]
MTVTNAVIKAANQFELHGKRTSVSLSLSQIDGGSQLTLHNSSGAHDFRDDAITIEETVLGSQFSVELSTAPDLERVTFSVVLPLVNLNGGNDFIDTIGVTATHRTTIGGVGKGQLTTYRTIRLRGTASQVQSLG